MKLFLLFFILVLSACTSKSSNQKTQKEILDSIQLAKKDSLHKDSIIRARLDSLSNLPVDTLQNEAYIIEPGKCIGRTCLSESTESIVTRLGNPDLGDAAMGKSISTWISKTDTNHNVKIYFTTNFGSKDETPKAKSIRINSPNFATRTNIKVGSSLKFVEHFYKNMNKLGWYKNSLGEKIYVYDSREEGIAFEINPNDIITGISIHEKGKLVTDQYIPFFENFNRGK